MSGLAEWFQKPHLQWANSTISLWHKNKGKKQRPQMKGLAWGPLFPPTACHRGRGRESTGRSRGIGHSRLHPCTKKQGERYTFRRDGANLFRVTLTEKTEFSREERRNRRDGLHTEDLEAGKESVSPAIPDKGLRHSAFKSGEGLPDP